MLRFYVLIAVTALLAACAAERSLDAFGGYEQLQHQGVVESPAPVGGRFAPADRDAVERGRYLVVLLGCGACHTNGAFEGAPDTDRGLAGSQTGIAWTNPLDNEHPGVVYPPNITPDENTGIGLWTDAQIAKAIRAGIGRHGSRRIVTMPWQAYSLPICDLSSPSITAYRQQCPPVERPASRLSTSVSIAVTIDRRNYKGLSQ